MVGVPTVDSMTTDVKGSEPGLQKIAEDQYLPCTRCGLCSYACPSYRAYRTQTYSARGRVALLRAVSQGDMDIGEAYGDRFYTCTLCSACDQACPSGVKVEDLLLAGREEIALREQLPPNLTRLSQAIHDSHNILGEDNAARLLWAENLEQAPSGTENQTAEVAFFVGCVSSLFPRSYGVPQAFVQIMEAAQVDYTLLGGEEWCCGYPLMVNGLLPEAKDTICHNVDAVRARGVRQVVFTCPSCYHVWKHVYPDIAGAEMYDLELLHATEYLAGLLENQDAHGGQPLPLHELNMTVAYHDPCDLGRKSGVYEAPRRVLSNIPGLTLVEMVDNRESALCCGGGGNVETYDPDLVAAISSRRLAQAQQAGAQAIVSACQQCERTLASAARRDRVRLRVMDIAEIVWKAVGK
jgi:heterodisulfide reductase subunit D